MTTNQPETHYAKSGDVHIAYQVTGEGPLDLVFVPGFVSHVEASWQTSNSVKFFSWLRGREIDTAGDAFFATFDGPARAICCAEAIQNAVTNLKLTVRVGLHTGECEVMEEKITGIAVHIGARVMGLAGPGEVLATSTVKDLVAGSGICFIDRGVHALKGVPGEWHLFAATC